MRIAAIEMGKEFGKSSVDIMNGMAEFGRVFKDTSAIKELTRVATMASNVTTMTAADAAKAINTTMITFKLGVKDAAHILDSFNEIDLCLLA
jgi:TP901 family phage tail tape measure protein